MYIKFSFDEHNSLMFTKNNMQNEVRTFQYKAFLIHFTLQIFFRNNTLVTDKLCREIINMIGLLNLLIRDPLFEEIQKIYCLI